jgi:stress-induced morphogen
MATLRKTPLVRKLEKMLTKRFPPPATVKLDDVDGIIGVITSDEFAGMETIDRQTLIGDVVESHLSKEERHQIQIIVAVTPDEGTGYLAGLD